MITKEEREGQKIEDEASQKILKNSNRSGMISNVILIFSAATLGNAEFGNNSWLSLDNPHLVAIFLLLFGIYFRLEAIHIFLAWKHDRDWILRYRNRQSKS
ncbi:MAG: hypothetical protein KUG78_15280 [Kangiellaceae bacterium]|nr:hypothetical protein [Kangiellaceae bacterium]